MKFTKYAGLLLLLAVLVSACSDSSAPTPAQSPDAKAIETNNQAVGLMGQFEYAQAHALFSELATHWPHWNDVRVNLAIATLNRQQPGDEMRALDIAREVLQAEPANLRAHYVAGLMQLYLGELAHALTHFEYVVEADPSDAHAAYYLAQCMAQMSDYTRALSWYQRRWIDWLAILYWLDSEF